MEQHKMAGKPTVVPLPESRDDILAVSMHGRIVLADYVPNFYNPMAAIVKKHGHFRLLVHYATDFGGWGKDAADLSFQSIYEYGRFARKIAYINPPEKKMFQVKLTGNLLSGDVRIFDKSQRDEALSWIREE